MKCPFSVFEAEKAKNMSVKFEKVTFNEKATGGGDTPGEVKKKQKSQYSSVSCSVSSASC